MRNFYILSFSQLISGLGSNITIFAIALWLFKKKEGSITDLALIHFINEIPRLLISPFSGILTDRCNRKTIMVVCDTIAALTTVFIGYCLYHNTLEIWHIYVSNFISSLSSSLQMPACSAVTPQIVPKDKLSYALGLEEVLIFINSSHLIFISHLLFRNSYLGVKRNMRACLSCYIRHFIRNCWDRMDYCARSYHLVSG